LEFGYWNDRTAGLLAGEGLSLALLQMDKARLSRPGRPLEIQRQISLIKTVAVTLEAEEGTFTNVSGSLVQLGNAIVMKADAQGLNAVDFLLGGKSARAPEAGALRSNWAGSQEIALSTGMEDSGLFE